MAETTAAVPAFGLTDSSYLEEADVQDIIKLSHDGQYSAASQQANYV